MRAHAVPVPRVDEDRAGAAQLVVERAVDAGGAALVVGADRHRVAVGVQRHRIAEQVARDEIHGRVGLHVCLLRPGIAAPREHVDRTRRHGRIVRLVAVDPAGVAVLARRPHRHRVAVAADGNRIAEGVALLGLAGIRCLEVGLLRPGRPAPREDIHRAGLPDRVVRLVAVDAAGAAVLEERADDQRIAVRAERHVGAELIERVRVGRLDERLRGPRAVAAGIDVDGAGIVGVVIGLVAVDGPRRAAFPGRPDGHRAAVGADRDGRSELIAVTRRRRLDVSDLRQRRRRRGGRLRLSTSDQSDDE